MAQGLVAQDAYAYISSHEALIGNENLSKEHVRSLHRFAHLLQNYLLNRKGILKDTHSTSRAYRAAKYVADGVTDAVAVAMFAGA